MLRGGGMGGDETTMVKMRSMQAVETMQAQVTTEVMRVEIYVICTFKLYALLFVLVMHYG